MFRQRRFWFGLIVSLFFLVWLFRGAELDKVWLALREANYWLVVPAVGTYFLGVIIRTWRWRVLLGPLKEITTWRLFPIVVIGYMVNNILPARLGELVRAYLVGEREGVNKAAVLATALVERMFDGLTLLLFLVGVLALFPVNAPFINTLALPAFALFTGALVVFLLLIARPAWTRRLLERVLRPLPARLQSPLRSVTHGFLEGLATLGSLNRAIVVFGASIAAWLLEAAMAYLIILGFAIDPPPPFHLLTLATAAANLATAVPATSGGIGPFEAFAAEALKLAGNISSEQATAFAILFHVALLVPITVLGFVFLWFQNLSLRELTQAPSRQLRHKESAPDRVA